MTSPSRANGTHAGADPLLPDAPDQTNPPSSDRKDLREMGGQPEGALKNFLRDEFQGTDVEILLPRIGDRFVKPRYGKLIAASLLPLAAMGGLLFVVEGTELIVDTHWLRPFLPLVAFSVIDGIFVFLFFLTCVYEVAGHLKDYTDTNALFFVKALESVSDSFETLYSDLQRQIRIVEREWETNNIVFKVAMWRYANMQRASSLADAKRELSFASVSESISKTRTEVRDRFEVLATKAETNLSTVLPWGLDEPHWVWVPSCCCCAGSCRCRYCCFVGWQVLWFFLFFLLVAGLLVVWVLLIPWPDEEDEHGALKESLVIVSICLSQVVFFFMQTGPLLSCTLNYFVSRMEVALGRRAKRELRQSVETGFKKTVETQILAILQQVADWRQANASALGTSSRELTHLEAASMGFQDMWRSMRRMFGGGGGNNKNTQQQTVEPGQDGQQQPADAAALPSALGGNNAGAVPGSPARRGGQPAGVAAALQSLGQSPSNGQGASGVEGGNLGGGTPGGGPR
uniref:Uncharacterized protein n=1 Tax=Chromera velia CCMP2878 TaxID=1169474 RepID=A0A0G4GUM9_9ALVE|mmetsp:Transcript_27051/g.53076  ORF Transcript_27051/g.53076 Transcript_27051/m.53076 type:complete len:515 (+) Transcript_27051:197-1741(+)|eukprot:Cvel_23457.t1-p1 / transcript=Cvel_23457.t1 / gene=Cvel_23457 / organism=Chromera_velia_CCMP2878 / gene_product=hypothetical protein / transcript_product=hypothetical protein / location=Cvel_scaffold2419:2250-10239(-) / protein_length=514 / sequence_SO=supercontig / SO=protein_coding / is_pseudo=false